MPTDYEPLRTLMVREQLARQGVRDPRVLDAFGRVPRHLFVRPENLSAAYEDHPLPIGFGQTISQPYIVAYMIEALNLTGVEKVLEIGTGSGYETALLAELAREVYTIERITELSQRAQKQLEKAGYRNIYFRVGDGTLGWSEHSPFDRIIVSAGAPRVPDNYINQLTDNGIIIVPVGDEYSQTLLRVKKQGSKISEETFCSCVFVKLIGEQGWQSK